MSRDEQEPFDELTPVAPNPAVRSRLVAQLRTRERWTPWTPPVAALLGISESDALVALQQVDDASAARRGVLPDSRVWQTPKLAEIRALIASLPAGTHIARHRHEERELTFVLDGELIEDGRRKYGSGELIDGATGTEHELTVLGTTECVVVFFLPRE